MSSVSQKIFVSIRSVRVVRKWVDEQAESMKEKDSLHSNTQSELKERNCILIKLIRMREIEERNSFLKRAKRDQLFLETCYAN